MKIKNILKVVAIAVLCLGSVDAKGGFSSSSSSSRSSSSFSSGSSSRSSSSSSWGSSSRSSSSSAPSRPSSSSSWGSSSSSSSKPSSASSSSGWGSSSKSATIPSTSNSTSSSGSKSSFFSRPQTSTRPQSNVDRQKYEAAVKSGKAFQTRDQAVADFKAKEANTYTSRYATEPTSRPAHIPQTYNNHTIVYNNGGYGYWSGGGPGLGTWMMYDIMSDAIMMNAMMDRSGYHHGPPPPATTVVHTSGGWGWGWFVIISIFVIGGILFAMYLIGRNV